MRVGDGVLRFLACGSVDDGKSTLIGHLLHLTGNLYDDQLQLLQTESGRIGTAGGAMDYSLLLDGLMAEREQGITIDVAYRYFSTQERKFVVADTPGHERYTRNMATAASQCAAALILVDAHQGLLPQTRRHALICAMMGIRSLLFAVNKMDMVSWSEEVFQDVATRCGRLEAELEHVAGFPLDCAVVPVSALHGDNLTTVSRCMPWYRGPSILDWLLGVCPEHVSVDTPFRMPVQYVIKGARSGGEFRRSAEQGGQSGMGTYRAYAGSVLGGTVRRGERVVVLPAGIQASVSRILFDRQSLEEATSGMAVSLELSGEHDIARGDWIVSESGHPQVANQFKARIVWMDRNPFFAGRQYLLRGLGGTVAMEATRIRERIVPETLQRLATDRLDQNDIGEADLYLSRPVPFDSYQDNRETGAFILIDRISNATVACGMILHALRRATNVQWQRQEVSREERAGMKGQRPGVIWFTGLSGSGKSTIANCLERRLHAMGRHTILLDGDNVRHGLNRDLGFSEADRIENIRRIGEVARLMTDAGLIVIAAFISPYRAERDMVRQLLSAGEFCEVYLSTPLEECERRDPKGLYHKARLGQIPNFTGINSPYEAPLAPEICLNTASSSVDECADLIMGHLEECLAEHGYGGEKNK
jgi:bifunctional enzyme CysN/CysC